MKLTDEQIQKAVNWWGDVIQNPKFDIGDSSPNGMLAQMLHAQLVKKLDPLQIIIFREELEKLLKEEQPEFFSLSVDYKPCKNLRMALEKARISHNNLPVKTEMWLDNGEVFLKYGYGADVEKIA